MGEVGRRVPVPEMVKNSAHGVQESTLNERLLPMQPMDHDHHTSPEDIKHKDLVEHKGSLMPITCYFYVILLHAVKSFSDVNESGHLPRAVAIVVANGLACLAVWASIRRKERAHA